ncbi:MAG TPA: Mrp/NBP35 family ATP-binding protein [Candidatus Spyradocola merdavium]|nr:Mrp/NBP35 family ATP-binding protein [Candidatus Spyradocola merdavium]
MSENCTHDCSSCGVDCPSRQQPEDMHEAPHALSNIKKVIGVVSGKGGVGKSMVTSLLAVALKRRNLGVGILDADITGPSIPKIFGLRDKATGDENGIYPVRTKTGIDVMSINLLLENETDPVVWRGPIIGGTVKQFWTDVIWHDEDVLFIDMPPGTGDVALTVFQTIKLDGLIIVTSPQELVSMIVEKAVNMAKLMDIPVLGLVENFSYILCPDCGKQIPLFGESHVEEVAEHFGLPILGKLPLDPRLASACDKGMIELAVTDPIEHAADVVEQVK